MLVVVKDHRAGPLLGVETESLHRELAVEHRGAGEVDERVGHAGQVNGLRLPASGLGDKAYERVEVIPHDLRAREDEANLFARVRLGLALLLPNREPFDGRLGSAVSRSDLAVARATRA